MELRTKLAVLADAAKYDASCASSGSHREPKKDGLGNTEGMGICHSYTPDGRCISLLKLLLTNVCIWDCSYCVNRRSSDVRRARFTVDEVVRLTINFYKRNYIEGLFLSSGIIQNADYTMEQLVLVAKKLREEERFGGYIHLKAVPGAAKELLLEAGKYADRLSANIEMPVQDDLDKLAPEKTVAEIESTMADVKYGIDDARDRGVKAVFARAGQSTQVVVGATESTDTTILTKAEALYNRFKLRRVYYSAFSPAADTTDALKARPRTPAMREHRLYEADWLIRNYGFRAHEVTEGLAGGNLDLDHDPKLAWAMRHRNLFPVDVNRASKSLLLRVPGIGVKNVHRILNIRRFHRVSLADLVRINVSINRAKWFITTADHNPNVFKLDSAGLPDVFRKKLVQPTLFLGTGIIAERSHGPVMIHTAIDNNLESWRFAARELLAQRVEPDDIIWSGETQGTLSYSSEAATTDVKQALRVPSGFIRLAEAAACYDDVEKWPLLYRILFRLSFENKFLLNIESDPDVREAKLMEKAVNRDVHKFHAFVRFREIECPDDRIFTAWHEPQHWSVERATPFFARRFGSMKWSIFTPKGCAHWNLKALTFSGPAHRESVAETDDFEKYWLLYYRSIFNPFRLNVKTMKRELPVRHWATLPEAELIPGLIREAAAMGQPLGERDLRDSSQNTATPITPPAVSISTS